MDEKYISGFKYLFLFYVLIVLALVILVPTNVTADKCNETACQKISEENYTVSTVGPNITVFKGSTKDSVNSGENFTFRIWVYNIGNGNATINVTDMLDPCFNFINNSAKIFYAENGINENEYTPSQPEQNGLNFTWKDMYIANASGNNFPYFFISFNVTAGECYGNFTNYVKVAAMDSNGLPLDSPVCSICEGNYSDKCANFGSSDDCFFSSYADCVETCNQENITVTGIKERLVYSKTVFINSSGTPILNLSKYAPKNMTYKEIIQFNISWSVENPYGGPTNITIIDTLSPFLNFYSCSNNCNLSNSKVIWYFENVSNGSSGVVYLNATVNEVVGNISNVVEIIGKSENKTANKFASTVTEILAGVISGRVFNDSNVNKFNDSNEQGLQTTIWINGTDINGRNFLKNVTSDVTTGLFSLFVPFGIYNISVVPLSGMINTTPQIYERNVNYENRSSEDNLFGFYIPQGVCPLKNDSCYFNSNITVFIDGNDTTNEFAYSGKPYSITVYARDKDGNPISNAIIRIWEWNGHNPFALSQFGQNGNNVTNYAVAEVKTDSNGNARFTIVPTGGIMGEESYVGTYNITLHLFANCSPAPIFSRYFNVRNRDLPNTAYYINISNKEDVHSSNNYIVNLYSRIKDWLAEGGGENHSIIIYTNGTVEGMDFNVTSGKPVGLNITVKYPNETVVSNATLRIIEKNGHNPFALSQFGTDGSNLTNYAIAEVKTDINGNARFTIVPTGGIIGKESYIGNYSIEFNVFVDDFTGCKDVVLGADEKFLIACRNRDLPQSSPPAYGIYNIGDIRSSNNYIVNLYNRIKNWLS